MRLVIGVVILGCLLEPALAQSGGPIIQPMAISQLSPHGLKFEYPDHQGVTLVGLHYSVNKVVRDVAPGDVNVDIRTKTGGKWVYEDSTTEVKPGDTVHYWYLVVIEGQGGHNDLNLQWTVPVPTTPSPSTSTSTHSSSTTTPGASGSTTSPSHHSTKSTTTTTNKPGPGPTSPPQPHTTGCTTYPCVIFEDDFDTLDFSKWQHEITLGGGGNWEFEYYTNNRSNTYVRNGILFIKPTLTSDKFSEQFLSNGVMDIWGGGPADLCTSNAFWGCERQGTGSHYINPIQSGRLRTVNSFNFKYGKVEVEAKMPTGDWIWPAIWMLPRYQNYGEWPASGEIDIVESRGNADLKDEKGEPQGVNTFASTLHWGPFYGADPFEKTHGGAVAKSGTFGTAFHNYTMEWDEAGIRTFLDGDKILDVAPDEGGFWKLGDFTNTIPGSDNPWKGAPNPRMAPFDQEFYLLMNVAVGGTNGFFQDNWVNNGPAKPWKNASPTAPRDFWLAKNSWYPTWTPTENNGENAALQVKSVRVWKLKPDP